MAAMSMAETSAMGVTRSEGQTLLLRRLCMQFQEHQ